MKPLPLPTRVGVMTEGRLHQINTPDALYRFPSTPEVARIVGECDFISGNARGNLVDTDIGALPYICEGGNTPDGSALTVLLRPQDISAHADDTGGCVVESVEYRGGETLLTVRTQDGATLRCRALGYSGLSRGSRVRMTPTHGEAFWAFPNS